MSESKTITVSQKEYWILQHAMSHWLAKLGSQKKAYVSFRYVDEVKALNVRMNVASEAS